LSKTDPNIKILVTVTSGAALEKAAKIADQVKLLPFDSCLFYWFALRRIKIKKVIFTETEIWPALIGYLSMKNIPITWVNARMMSDSFGKYTKFRWFFRRIFLKIDSIAAQTDTDADRFRRCGALNVQVLGNAKYQQDNSPLSLDSSVINLIKNFGQPVVSITNIRPQEDQIIFPVIRNNQSKILFFIMPRHREAYSYFQNSLEKSEIQYISIDQFLLKPVDTGVVFVDKFGVLEELVSVSSAVIAAGSFLPRYKGHNLLVAAQHSIPMCTGKYNESSQPILDELKANDAVFIAQNTDDISIFINQVINRSETLLNKAINSNNYLKKHLGAVDKIVNWIQGCNATSNEDVNRLTKLLFPILYLLSCVYGLVTYIRNKLFDLKVFKSYKSKKFVISVGNISVGGTGKTPLVIKLVTDLTNKGYRCAVLSRGYGGSQKGPFVITNQNIDSVSYKEVGDEPLEIFHATKTPVVISKNRVLGVRLIEDQNLADIVILDDGFQHRWLMRDVDIVCVDVSSVIPIRQFLSADLLPLGILREKLIPATQRADIIVFSTRQSGKACSDIESSIKTIKTLIPNIKSVASYYGAPELKSISGNKLTDTDLLSRKTFIFCGIGNPEGFINTINKFNFNLVQPVLLFKDHHSFSLVEINLINEKVNLGHIVVTTRKDYMRLPVELQQKIYWVNVSLITEPDLVSVLLLEGLQASAF
jgi:tetraacyldisaccharide 4'-kinase